MHVPMIETKAGATEPSEITAFLPNGGPPTRTTAALTRKQCKIVNAVNHDDAAWFRRHPDQHQRTRFIVRGEFAPIVEDPTWTRVTVFRDGDRRIRVPVAPGDAA